MINLYSTEIGKVNSLGIVLESRPLIHEKVYPNFPETYFKNTIPTESNTHDRTYFANRKADRVTISERYAESGKTPKGKNWVRWKTSYTLSVTYRQPAYLDYPTINVFYTGKVFGGASKGVLNVTNKGLGSLYVPDAVLEVFLEEFDALLQRQGVPSNSAYPKASSENSRYNALNPYKEQAMTYILSQAYPLYASLVSNNQPIIGALAPLYRCPNIQTAAEFLKIDKASTLNNYLASTFQTLNTLSLFILMATISVLPDEKRMELVEASENGEFQPIQYKPNVNNSYGIYNPVRGRVNDTHGVDNFSHNLPTLREVLRRLHVDDRVDFIHSFLNNVSDFEKTMEMKQTLELWKSNYKALNSLYLKKDQLKPNNMEGLKGLIELTIKSKTAEATVVSHEDIESKLKALCDGKYVNWMLLGTEATKKKVYAKIGVHNLTMLEVPNPIDGKYKLQVLTEYASFKKSVLWQMMKKNPLITAVPNTIDPYFTSTRVGKRKTDHISMPAVAYMNFINNLEKYIHDELSKNKVKITKENVAICLSVLFLVAAKSEYKKYDGKIPRKFFTLLRHDIKPELILAFLNKKVSVKMAIELKGLPVEWVYRSLKIPMPRRASTTYDDFA